MPYNYYIPNKSSQVIINLISALNFCCCLWCSMFEICSFSSIFHRCFIMVVVCKVNFYSGKIIQSGLEDQLCLNGCDAFWNSSILPSKAHTIRFLLIQKSFTRLKKATQSIYYSILLICQYRVAAAMYIKRFFMWIYSTDGIFFLRHSMSKIYLYKKNSLCKYIGRATDDYLKKKRKVKLVTMQTYDITKRTDCISNEKASKVYIIGSI